MPSIDLASVLPEAEPHVSSKKQRMTKIRHSIFLTRAFALAFIHGLAVLVAGCNATTLPIINTTDLFKPQGKMGSSAKSVETNLLQRIPRTSWSDVSEDLFAYELLNQASSSQGSIFSVDQPPENQPLTPYPLNIKQLTGKTLLFAGSSTTTSISYVINGYFFSSKGELHGFTGSKLNYKIQGNEFCQLEKTNGNISTDAICYRSLVGPDGQAYLQHKDRGGLFKVISIFNGDKLYITNKAVEAEIEDIQQSTLLKSLVKQAIAAKVYGVYCQDIDKRTGECKTWYGEYKAVSNLLNFPF